MRIFYNVADFHEKLPTSQESNDEKLVGIESLPLYSLPQKRPIPKRKSKLNSQPLILMSTRIY